MKEFLKIFVPVWVALMFVNTALAVIENPYMKVIASMIIAGLSLLIFAVLKFRK